MIRKTTTYLLLILSSIVLMAAHKGRRPWQRRIGRNVEIQHRKQHMRVSPHMWPQEPVSPEKVELEQFSAALRKLCGETRIPPKRALNFSKAIIDYSAQFNEDPFLVAALISDQSRCLPRQPGYETRLGLSRIDLKMHSPHIRSKKYNYWIFEDSKWHKQSIDAHKYPFNEWRLTSFASNIYWTAAILSVFKAQQPSLALAFPNTPYRHYVSHWFFGDNVRNTEPEDRILTARRRILDYYFNVPTKVIGSFNGVNLVSPLDGTPRMVLDDFGVRRGDKKTGYIHQGLDIVAVMDEPLYAIAEGRVIFAGVDLPGQGSKQLTIDEANSFCSKKMGNGGLYVAISHEKGFRTYYMHMDSISVTNGQQLKAGENIGTVGRSGSTESGPHLHLEFRVGTQREDPAKYISAILVNPSKF